ncbi:sulfatase family protein [Couchioplanes caeruleus]|uniref:Sulfatase n=2 Tax=Couchioplanes caeruleus TaxID=56438 RepID=A0A1K0FG89_9ACTN|nr:sulfatase [Couchioplanes caeruleus]OJF11863.1 sulfatase [Couchioplanes caeruleus subsp. caeruleus]ROP27808.1 arylsulfatase A-like enzyme [Couchioplanes caeruleus]
MGFRLRVAGMLAAVSLLTSCTSPRPAEPAASAATAPSAAPAETRPNIVFVLTDDLSMNLVQFMPHVRELQRRGTTFTEYTVSNSLCCPSRASLLTGKFPHGTGVFTNGGVDGGFALFHRRGHERSTFATDLRKAGYRTAFLGKYLNRYQPENTLGGTRAYVPPGWTDWYGAGNAYAQYDYVLNENGTVHRYGSAPEDYLTDVIGAKASAFIEASAAARTPFLVEVATFAPHSPYTPAPRDAEAFPGLRAPRGPAFDALPAHAPPWLADRAPLTAEQKAEIDHVFRKRAQSVRSVDRLLASLQATLERAGVAEDTVVVFSSDNGFHLGEYRLLPGKQTAFDTDVRAPLVVAGPGVRAGLRVAAPVQNIDLRPTFAGLAGAAVPADLHGRDLRPLLSGGEPAWRTAALIEHHGPDFDPADPDRPRPGSGNPPSYAALRTATYTYVEYVDGAREFYNRRTDPHQLRNLFPRLSPSRRAALHTALKKLTTCRGAACRTADRVRG